MEREPNTQYVLSLSYGKDSIACIEAVNQLGYPLDRIVHAEVRAVDEYRRLTEAVKKTKSPYLKRDYEKRLKNLEKEIKTYARLYGRERV